MEDIQKTAVVDPDSAEVAAGFRHDNLEGWIPELATDAEVFDAFEKAFDYRGDVVITRKDGDEDRGLYLRPQGGEVA